MNKEELFEEMGCCVRRNIYSSTLAMFPGMVLLVVLHETKYDPGFERVVCGFLGLLLGWMLGIMALAFWIRHTLNNRE